MNTTLRLSVHLKCKDNELLVAAICQKTAVLDMPQIRISGPTALSESAHRLNKIKSHTSLPKLH